ncbi:MAG: type II toxin-antitoxin system RelE/ParE family toxin [bacterium]
MARYEVFVKPSAAKELDGVGTKKDRQRLVSRIRELIENPRPHGFQKLSGADKYRIRCGNYRVVYSINDDEHVVQVGKIGHRREVYR